MRVVVIDDDPMFLRLIQKAFETAEPAAVVLSATGFARGRAALRQLDQLGLLPDLILIDRSLGDGNGVEMLEFLRAEAVFAGVPAVMVSAVVDGEIRAEAEAAGAAACYEKPGGFDPLVELAEALIRLAKERQQPVPPQGG